MRYITTINFTALSECHTKWAPWHRSSRRQSSVVGVWGAKCCCATANCRLSFRARQPNRLREGSQLDQGTALANRTAGECWATPEVSDMSGRQVAPDFARSDIRFSLFDGECPRRKSIAGSPPYRRKLVRCVKQRRSYVTFARPPEEAGRFLCAWLCVTARDHSASLRDPGFLRPIC